jgi:hypothetical protein
MVLKFLILIAIFIITINGQREYADHILTQSHQKYQKLKIDLQLVYSIFLMGFSFNYYLTLENKNNFFYRY